MPALCPWCGTPLDAPEDVAEGLHREHENPVDYLAGLRYAPPPAVDACDAD